jgi:hypothetical protein
MISNSIPGRGKTFFSSPVVHSGSKIHPASISADARCLSEANHCLCLVPVLRLDGAVSLLPFYAFMACTGTILSQQKLCLFIIFSVFCLSLLSSVQLFLLRGVHDFGEVINHAGRLGWGGSVVVFGELQ